MHDSEMWLTKVDSDLWNIRHCQCELPLLLSCGFAITVKEIDCLLKYVTLDSTPIIGFFYVIGLVDNYFFAIQNSISTHGGHKTYGIPGIVNTNCQCL